MKNNDDELEKTDMSILADSLTSSSEYSAVLTIPSPTYNIDIHNNEEIKIENIQEEDNLIEYTTNHFTNKFYEDLRKIQMDIHNSKNIESFVRSNSPLSMSNYGSKENSISGSGSDSETDNNILNSTNYNYYNIERSLDKYYDNISDTILSNEIDILITYVKGQKHLYTQSKNLIQWKLNMLMFPALLLPAIVTIIAPFIECQHWSVGAISAINATIAFLVSLMNYLKYESSIESYLQLEIHFDKFETSLDLTNSKLLLMENDIDKRHLIFHKIKEFEKKMNEIKEFNKIMIPEETKRVFPLISNIQIFSFIKKIDNYKKSLLAKYKDVNKEIKYILKKWKLVDISNSNVFKLKDNNRLEFLYDIKDKIKNEIYSYKNAYNNLDSAFSKEITNAQNKNSTFYCFQKKNIIPINPIINKYIDFTDYD
jgi:hypothetical protein